MRLRTAYERYHELKNRYRRTGGPERRCDRYKRLDIDYIYNTSAGMGRPRLSRLAPDTQIDPSSDRPKHIRHTKRRADHSRDGPGENPVPLATEHRDRPVVTTDTYAPGPLGGSCAESGRPKSVYGPGSPDDLGPILGILDSSLVPGGVHCADADWNLRLESADFASLMHNDPLGVHKYQRDRGGDYEPNHPGDFGTKILPHQPKGHDDLPTSAEDKARKDEDTTTGITGSDELLQLQIRLKNLLKGAGNSPKESQPPLDEIMMICKELLELLPTQGYRAGSEYNINVRDRTMTGNLDISINGNGNRFNTEYIIGELNFAFKYLKCRAGDVRLVSLGTFNLASQPSMSTSVGAYMISSMITQLREAISLLMPELQQCDGPTPPLLSPPPSDMWTSAKTSAPMSSIQAALGMLSKQEKALLDTLAQIMNGS
ncbi:Uncharacterized protein PECH_006860 [Penicillium ucsense]|uniref:Uncharacterized protein n=1 Tax=Penicillium ucsense TaxID=2839758 RepID=A0A8J8WCN3_9EURO|nr:Uncharacterized protein PECM_006273 [Penicillium ucsense]KAF7735268.1 Uncharacterized protein PECH_006860 [Penicillium ucsense]